MGKLRVEPRDKPLQMVAVHLDGRGLRPSMGVGPDIKGADRVFQGEDTGLKIAVGKYVIEVGVACDLCHLERVLGLLEARR